MSSGSATCELTVSAECQQSPPHSVMFRDFGSDEEAQACKDLCPDLVRVLFKELTRSGHKSLQASAAILISSLQRVLIACLFLQLLAPSSTLYVHVCRKASYAPSGLKHHRDQMQPVNSLSMRQLPLLAKPADGSIPQSAQSRTH